MRITNRLTPTRRALARRTLCVVGIGALLGTGYAVASGFVVALGPAGPSPQVLTVQWGDTVTWTNGDTETHQLASPRATFTSPSIAPGGSYTHTYTTRAGSYAYRQQGSKKTFGANVAVEVKGTVSLEASKKQILYGGSVTLSGVSTLLSSEVLIAQRLAGKPWAQFQTVTTDELGNYSIVIDPPAGARYKATVAGGQISSPDLQIDVLPIISVGLGAKSVKTGATVKVAVYVKPAGAATSVNLFRYDAKRKLWVRAMVPQTVRHGVAIFHWPTLPGKTLLRASLLKSNLLPGYAPTSARTVAVTGIGDPKALLKAQQQAKRDAARKKKKHP
jgi:hypothetical protein